MYRPNLKRLSPLFIVLATGCASYKERPEYTGCHKTIYEDTVRLGEVVNSKVVGGSWDQKCHEDTVALEEQRQKNALALAEQKKQIEIEKSKMGVRERIFENLASMEMANPVLDQQRRTLLVDSVFQYVENQTAVLSEQGYTPETRAEYRVLELFEIYDMAKSQSDIENPVVKDAILQRAVNEIVTLYNGGQEPLYNDLYRKNIDEYLMIRGASIKDLEAQFKPGVIVQEDQDQKGRFLIFGLDQ